MKPLIRLLRPKQWTKNLLVFAAYVFAEGFHSVERTVAVLLAFVTMCAASSATYVFNDLADADRDRLHPTKKNRPIASGAVTVQTARFAGVGLAVLAVLLGAALGLESLIIVCLYAAIQVAYNLGLKRIPVADVFGISMGFVLRAVLGAAAIHAYISGWLLYCTAALALMLGFSKRRQEFIAQGEDRAQTRESLVAYTRTSLDVLVTIAAGSAAVCYGVYSIESSTAQRYPALILTSFFVVYGICRYALLVFSANEGGEPADVLFGDRHMIFSFAGFLVTALIAVSGVRIPLLER